MFSPRERELERGWPGRVDGDRVVQLAAQTLESFFTGGGGAREHAEYPLDEVVFRAARAPAAVVRVFSERARVLVRQHGLDLRARRVRRGRPARSVEARWCVGAVVGAEARSAA